MIDLRRLAKSGSAMLLDIRAAAHHEQPSFPAAQIERVFQTPSRWLREIREALRFLSRLPLPEAERDAAAWTLASVLRWAPVAGVIIALGPAAALVLGDRIGLGGLTTAALAVSAMMVLTGALHEDGFADLADGFGGGKTRERKLAIMRDSRIGTFGALALACSVITRIGCLQHLLDTRSAWTGGAALIAAAGLSRALMLVPMALLPPARTDGLAHAAGSVGMGALATALAFGLLLAVTAVLPGAEGVLRLAVAAAAASLASLGMTTLARRQIGGVTGDVVGATQQVSEIALLLALSARSGLL